MKPSERASSVEDASGDRSPVSEKYVEMSPPCSVRGTGCTSAWPMLKSSKKRPEKTLLMTRGRRSYPQPRLRTRGLIREQYRVREALRATVPRRECGALHRVLDAGPFGLAGEVAGDRDLADRARW